MTSGMFRIFRSQSRKACWAATTFRSWITAISLVCVLAAGSASAHHSATQYDAAKRVTLTGTLTKVDWRNPHIEISLEVKDDSGHAKLWLVETVPPNRFASHNIRRAIFDNAIGQILMVEISPTRDGSLFGILRKIAFPDGSVVQCGNEGVGGNCVRESTSQR